MRPIPIKHRKIINSDPYFKKSCLSQEYGTYENRIVIHHTWIYGGKQINELWAYMPLTNDEHENLDLETREKIKWLSLQRVDIKDLLGKYPKYPWEREYNYLSKKFMSEKKKPKVKFQTAPKKVKFTKTKKCPKCGSFTSLFICPTIGCGHFIGGDKKK